MNARATADDAARSFLASYTAPSPPSRVLSDEQEAAIASALEGHDVLVDSVIGSGKTTMIQELCNRLPQSSRVLYLTYSKLLKLDAKERIRNRNVSVHNYHGLAWWLLNRLGVRTGVSTMIERTIDEFPTMMSRGLVPVYDVIIIDEYQDVVSEYAQLLRLLLSVSTSAQLVVVGDMSQKLRDNTTLDVQAFFEGVMDHPVRHHLTQSFRMGSALSTSLARSWGRDIVGVNRQQKVETITADEALTLMMTTPPADLLVLGRQRGQASRVLNTLEERAPNRFNKSTVYSSISTEDTLTRPGREHAIFTTFDASKGLERRVLFVFDYDEVYWLLRKGMPGTDPQILRNIFLVAASRGKEAIYFVEPRDLPEPVYDDRGHIIESEVPYGVHDEKKAFIGGVPEQAFIEAGHVEPPVYDHPLNPSSMYDFVLTEDLTACEAMLDKTLVVETGRDPVIETPSSDALIDLGFVVGIYQEALFFTSWDARRALMDIARSLGSNERTDVIVSEYMRKLSGYRQRKRGKKASSSGSQPFVQPRDRTSLWQDCLVLAEAQTGLRRYTAQVSVSVPDEAVDQLVRRLGDHLDPDVPHQGWVRADGIVTGPGGRYTEIMIIGRTDAVDADGVVWEVKNTSELTREHFCQLGMYLAISGYESGRLFNTRTGELWEVRVPDAQAYLDASIRCTTKGWYQSFDGECTYSDPEDTQSSRTDLHDTQAARDMEKINTVRRWRERQTRDRHHQTRAHGGRAS